MQNAKLQLKNQKFLVNLRHRLGSAGIAKNAEKTLFEKTNPIYQDSRHQTQDSREGIWKNEANPSTEFNLSVVERAQDRFWNG